MGERDVILDYTLASVKEYPVQSAHRLMEVMIAEGIATKKKTDDDKVIYVGDLTDKQGVSQCLNELDIALKSVEKWEIEKNYKYSMLFEFSGFEESKLEELITEGKIITYEDNEECEDLYSVIQNPSLLKTDEEYIFKYNLKLEATDVFGNELRKRYPILAIFNISESIMEIRFDSVSANFSKDKFKFAKSVLEWLRKFMCLEIKAMDLLFIAEWIKKNGKEDGVILAGQDMIMSGGGKATIDIGKSTQQILPFIGELKNIMEEYSEEFEKAENIRNVLEEFIYEKENLSEFPWVKFKFEDKNIEVKFTFDYGPESGCLLQHFHSGLKANQGRERMDYVTSYIAKVRNIIAELPDEEE